MKRIVWLLMFIVAAPALAQEEPVSDLRLAYEKEYAFLDAQRRALEARIAQFEQSARAERDQAQAALEVLESQWLAEQSQAQRLQEQVTEAERTLGDNQDQGQLLTAIIDQARQTLAADHRLPEHEATDPARRLAALFIAANGWLGDMTRLHRESGAFFLADGSRVEGQIIRLGAMAAYGISPEGAGALVPAGEGRWQLWPDEAGAATAQALAAGQWPRTLALFLLDRRLTAAPESGEKSLTEVIESGGVIAWVIVALGALAVVLVFARMAFLYRAGSRNQSLTAAVAEQVAQGNAQEALALCERSRSAAGRVLAAALRNLDRDREHQDDIISEAILHESVHLDRFGSFLLVIAAVSPLLGLLGTVTGMIATFDVITEFGTGDPKLLSGGISEALVTTELGLVVAIPVLILGSLLSGWSEAIKRDLERSALHITNRHEDSKRALGGSRHVERRLAAS